MWYISGNRDEDKIERADEFIIDRVKPRQHLAFGAGIHRCVGDRLAEQQLRILWEEILRRDLRFKIMGAPRRLYSNFIRGIRACRSKSSPSMIWSRAYATRSSSALKSARTRCASLRAVSEASPRPK